MLINYSINLGFNSTLILNTIATSSKIDKALHLKIPELHKEKGESFSINEVSLVDAVERVLNREAKFFKVNPDGSLDEEIDPGVKKVIVCGSFNPLHRGHRKLFDVARQLTQKKVAFEMSIFNADISKPPLSREGTLERIAQFAGTWPIYITNAPTFISKAQLFPNTVFVVGHDTAIRIIQKKYYSDSEEKLQQALQELHNLQCSFLVAGRKLDDDFKTCETIEFPSYCQDMFTPIPSTLFREDISSTSLRQQGIIDKEVFKDNHNVVL